MENDAKLGMNRTGIQMSPFEGPNQAEFALTQPAHPPAPDGQADMLRADYIRTSERVGSVPVPGTFKGLATSVIDKMAGNAPEMLIDKLGQRLAFERSGVRLYQAMVAKVKASQPDDANGLLADLNHICEEEFEHFQMLIRVVENMGADPTAQTPCADISAVASLGIIQVITDPRTTIAQSLEALLTAELTDNACWELLIELVSQSGHDDLIEPFGKALAAEQEHVIMITNWLRAYTL